MASVFTHLLCLIFLLLPPSAVSQTSDKNIPLGASLISHNESSFWLSPSGEFAFGFYRLEEDLFLLAIWFAKIENVKSIIWTAYEGKPVHRGSRIELTTEGELILRDRNNSQLWKPPMDGSQASSAAMLDTGNFVLRNESNNIWESFNFPTDTILPTQILNRGGKLLSRQTDDDYSTGKFKLELQLDGNLVMYITAQLTGDNYAHYWSSDTVGFGSQLIFNQSGDIYLTVPNRTKDFYMTEKMPVSTRDFYQRATFDFDGVFRQYNFPKTSNDGRWSSQSWSVAWYKPPNICTAIVSGVGGGTCGYNSYCRLDDKLRPKCECPPEYVPSDPKNAFKGCKQNFLPLSCETDIGLMAAGGFEMREIPNTDWPGSDYRSYKAMDEDKCRKFCLDDCFCVGAVIGAGDCWLKFFPLQNGRMDPGNEFKALIKVRNSSSLTVPHPDFGGNKKDKEDNDKLILLGSIFLGSSVFLNFLLFLAISLAVFYILCQKKLFKIRPEPSTFEMNLRSFTYKELEEATDCFKEELGKGAFSTVYKGVLRLGNRSLVAVKKLNNGVQEIDNEFIAEVSAIGGTNHKNLVQLLGFCDEGSHRLLVYEFMRNGSLASFLFGNSRPDWYRRIQIAFGIARGLTYLHEECSTHVIHCDVKPQNILIDDSLEARISDFGLAKLLKTDQSRTSTGIRGTRGYVAPEWFKNMAITAKVDVYSFGIVLLEIICCRRNVEFGLEDEEKAILSDWAYDCFRGGKLHLLVGNDEEAMNDSRRLEKWVMVAIWCIQEEPSIRPSMKKVTQMLEGAIEISMPPDPSSFSISSIG